jgi:hypothetical protein
MDRLPHSSRGTNPKRSYNMSRAQFELLEENRKKEFNAAKKKFDLYKDRLGKISHRLTTLKINFDESFAKANELQNVATTLFNRFLNVNDFKEGFIRFSINAKITEKKVYNDALTHGIPPELLMQIGIHDPGEATKKAISDYLREKKLNPSNFEDVLDILAKVDDNLQPEEIEKNLRKSLIKALSLEKVIDSQNHVFTYMSNTNQKLHSDLKNMRSEFGGSLDQFFESAAKHYMASDFDGRDQHIAPLCKIDLDECSTVNYRISQSDFIAAKRSNWHNFNENHKRILLKERDYIVCLDKMHQQFSGRPY